MQRKMFGHKLNEPVIIAAVNLRNIVFNLFYVVKFIFQLSCVIKRNPYIPSKDGIT